MKTTNILKLSIISLLALCASASAMERGKAIHSIKLNGSVKLNAKGHFKDTKSVKNFLKKASQYIINCPNPEVSKMGKEAQIAHFGTAQLYKIRCSNGVSYILKEIKDTKKAPAREEIKRLELLRGSKRLAPYINKTKDNLRIILPSQYLSYTYKGKRHILVLMRTAHGLSLQDLMQKFKAMPDNKELQKALSNAFYQVGAAMAHFYTSVGTLRDTIQHRDFHTGNIFYDPQTGLVSLIDNERMATGGLCDTGDIRGDLGTLFVTSPFVLKWAPQSTFFKGFMAKDGEIAKKWYSLCVPSFVLGFIRTFPKKERVSVFRYLKDRMLKWDSKVKKDESKSIRGLIKEQFKILETQLVKEDKTALHIAAGNRFLTALVKKLLFDEKTTAVIKKDKDGNMPIHEAAYFGHKLAIPLLIKAGSPVEPRNNKGETPLFKAKYNLKKNKKRYEATIRSLTDHGARK